MKDKAMPRHRHVQFDVDHLASLSRAELRDLWARDFGEPAPASLGRDILALGVAYSKQERIHGGIRRSIGRELDRLLSRALRPELDEVAHHPPPPLPRIGTVLVREWNGVAHHVTIVADGFVWNGQTHRSLSRIARAITGTTWNGPRFFGMREAKDKASENCRGS